MQAKHLWYNLGIRWVDLAEKLEVAPTGLTKNDIWRHLFLTKQRKPYEEGCYNGEDFEDVKRQWEAKKEYFLEYKKDGSHPPCIDLATALHGFGIDNTAAHHAIEESKALHARRWQTKETVFTVLRGRLCLMLTTRRTYPLRMCYCVTKLHRCFHYDVDSDFVLHSNCRCSENVDVATDKFWPVVTMCRPCSPFPEGQNDGNSPAH